MIETCELTEFWRSQTVLNQLLKKMLLLVQTQSNWLNVNQVGFADHPVARKAIIQQKRSFLLLLAYIYYVIRVKYFFLKASSSRVPYKIY